MIKTMLLTAQLALSPIVGTNGLQPKRLPNPVYGETTDYSVRYNGATFERLGYSSQYGDYYKNEYDEEATYLAILVEEQNKELVVTDSPTAWLNTDIETRLSASYDMGWFCFYWNEDTEEWLADDCFLADNTCWAFFWQDEQNTEAKYFQFFGSDGVNDAYGAAISYVNQNGTYMEYDNEELHGLAEFGLPSRGTFYFQKGNKTFQGNTPLIIPMEQPTIGNPSVYDNIYNFYYQNLFANEALDELGAEVGNNSLTMRQWLAHTATIVSISLLAAALVVLVIKIFKLIAGSISDIWG